VNTEQDKPNEQPQWRMDAEHLAAVFLVMKQHPKLTDNAIRDRAFALAAVEVTAQLTTSPLH